MVLELKSNLLTSDRWAGTLTTNIHNILVELPALWISQPTVLWPYRLLFVCVFGGGADRDWTQGLLPAKVSYTPSLRLLFNTSVTFSLITVWSSTHWNWSNACQHSSKEANRWEEDSEVCSVLKSGELGAKWSVLTNVAYISITFLVLISHSVSS